MVLDSFLSIKKFHIANMTAYPKGEKDKNQITKNGVFKTIL